MLKKLIDYLVNDLGIKADAAATIILTLFTFLLGFIFTWIGSQISKWGKRKKYRKILKVIINDFLKSCEKQYLEFEKFSTQKGFLYGSNYTIAVVSSYSQNYLGKLDINIFIENFSSLLKKNRAHEISQLFEFIEQVNSIKESLKETVNFAYLKYSENFEVYNENLDSLRKIHDDLALQFNGKIVDIQLSSYIQTIIEPFANWKKNGGITHISVTLEEIVNPLYNSALLVTPNQISRNIIDYTLKCRLSVENIKNIENLMKSKIDESLSVYKNAFIEGSIIVEGW